MWNVLYQYYQDVVKPCKGKSDAWLNMAANSTYYGQTQFDAERLAFLLNFGEHQIYPKAMLEEMRYKYVINLIEMRNSVVMNQVHPALAGANVKVGTEQLSKEFIEKTIGIDITHKLKVWTPEIMKQVESNLHFLREAHDALRGAMKRLQLDQKFLSVEFKDI